VGGRKQEELKNVIELLNKLGKLPAVQELKKIDIPVTYRAPENLFEQLTGYSWRWNGEHWVESLEEILAKYQAESKRVTEALA
jgi:hypothetical protein